MLFVSFEIMLKHRDGKCIEFKFNSMNIQGKQKSLRDFLLKVSMAILLECISYSKLEKVLQNEIFKLEFLQRIQRINLCKNFPRDFFQQKFAINLIARRIKMLNPLKSY